MAVGNPDGVDCISGATISHGEFVEANRGIRERVLFESKEKDGSMSGYTGNYIRITRPYDEALVGKLTELII